jgi:uncharacterized membrane protein YgdD (TMEM256/DUF423 family)
MSLSSVIFGAAGSHWLSGYIYVDRIDTYETAVRFHMYLSVIILLVVLILRNIGRQFSIFNPSLVFFLFGSLIFSGSLYLLSLSDISLFGTLAPVGGIMIVLGWIFFIYYIYDTKANKL